MRDKGFESRQCGWNIGTTNQNHSSLISLIPAVHCAAGIVQSAKWYHATSRTSRVVVWLFITFPALCQAIQNQCTAQQIQNFYIQCDQTAASFLANEAYCVGLFPDHNMCGYHSFLGIQPIASGGLGCKIKWVKPPVQAADNTPSPVISNALTLACSIPSNMPSPPKNAGKSCENDQGNPINIGVGNKHQHELDYTGAGEFPLRMERTYNSNAKTKKGLGIGWNTYYDREIFYDTNGIIGVGRNSIVTLSRDDGKRYQFTQTDTSNAWIGDADSLGVLVQQGTSTTGNSIGWSYTTDQGDVESYNASGKLTAISNRAGLAQTLRYSCTTINSSCLAITPATVAPRVEGLLISVTDYAGRQINFTYDVAGRVATMIDSKGGSYSYSYSNTLPEANLTSVTYPDDTPSDLTNNPKRTYIYGELANTSNVSQPNVLTGIIDENNVRYATYQYDATSQAISTEHATGGIEKYSLAYNPDGSIGLTDPLGSVRTTHFTTVLGIVKLTGTDQPGGSGCSAAATNITYDTNGNVTSRTDFNGTKSCYAYDLSRNLETVRIEGLPGTADCAASLTAASLTAPARKITTLWHTSYRLPLQIAEPKKLITYNYDPAGNALTHTEQATTDVTGTAELTPLVQGSSRTWTYTYNSLGQVLTADGPRTDVVDKTTYTYYPATDANPGNRGNLYTVTNALNQVTTLSNYDANGRVGTITAPNTLVTNLAYYPRGWLKILTLSYGTYVETTQYTYYPTGFLKTVTLPDSSVLTYGYDAAHRLTSVTDSLGNKVSYTLDNAGNRLKEQTTDIDNLLRRNITRVYDALNRLQTVTGAVQ